MCACLSVRDREIETDKLCGANAIIVCQRDKEKAHTETEGGRERVHARERVSERESERERPEGL